MLENININDLNIKYWYQDNNSKETTLFIHGLCGDHRGLLECSRYLKTQNVIILDLPGYGLSEPLKKTHDLEGYADFISDFLNKLGLEKINLVGHSFGASVSLKFFNKFPEKLIKLILISPVVSETKTFSYKFAKSYFKLATLFNDKIFHFLTCNKLIVYITDIFIIKTKNKDTIHQILSEDYENYQRAKAQTIRDSFYSLDSEGFDFANPNSIDILVIIGKEDQLSGLKNLNLISSIPNLKVSLKEGGHLINQERPSLVGKMIARFLD